MPVAAPLIGLALSAAGTAASVAANNKVRNEQNRVLTNVLQQQQELAQQAQPVVARSVVQSGPQAAQSSIGQGAQQALNDYQKLQQTQLAGAANPALTLSTGTISGDPMIRAKQRQLNQSSAALAGYDKFALDQAVNNLMVQGKLNTIGALSNNASSTLPLELQGAQNKYASLSGIGSLGESLGSTIGAYGMTRPNKTNPIVIQYSSPRGTLLPQDFSPFRV